ncbi:tlde1 domain-containing protein [Glaciimonas soli]|uniref:DUF2778 domain-containing protein n=1 Tax=Glaciimonas soli TaxID=2590999 RepID=A0A843YXA8_9BURK|nr:tlde1 domain-containing protein [Glaciimonas soli]MQR02108.1 DUF2778 domain-containing protein [Glaciimonas soli]
MPWEYSQRSGQLRFNGENVATAYSGTGAGRNNPDMEAHSNVGPIPRGQYRIGFARDTATYGPHVMSLAPVGNTGRGRTAFLVHGDNTRHDAPQGCIILPRNARNSMSSSHDTTLNVVE